MRTELAGEKAQHMLAFETRAVRAFGAEARIFARQLLFWDTKGIDPTGFIWKTQDEWREETGLSRWAQRKARKILKAKEVLEEDKKGVPRRLFFRLDLQALMDAVGPYAEDEVDGQAEEADASPPADPGDLTHDPSFLAADEREHVEDRRPSQGDHDTPKTPETETQVKPEKPLLPPEEWERFKAEMREDESSQAWLAFFTW